MITCVKIEHVYGGSKVNEWWRVCAEDKFRHENVKSGKGSLLMVTYLSVIGTRSQDITKLWVCPYATCHTAPSCLQQQQTSEQTKPLS